MFLNRVTTRELFANNSNEKHEYSERSDTMSQFQYSQNDFTQYSQDFCNSQQMSSGSDSQGKKIFERYMSGGQTNRKTPAGQPKCGSQTLPTSQNRAPKMNFQQQIQLNKCRAKENDERDLLHSIVNIVKDCSDEVKDAIKNLKEGLGQALDSSDDKLATAINSVSDMVSQSYDKMIEAVTEKDNRISKEMDMEKEICIRDTQLTELRNELVNLQKLKENATINQLKEILQHQQSSTECKLQHLVDIAKEQLEKQKQILSTQEENKKENLHLLKSLHEENQQKYENTEERVLDEVMMLRKDLEKNKKELEEFYSNQLRSFRQKQTSEIQQHIQSGLDQREEISYEQSKELWNLQYKHLSELCKTQQSEIESYIRMQINEQTRFQQHQQEKQIEKQKIELEQHAHSIRDQVVTDIKSDLKKGKWEFHDSVPKSLQAQLDTMHNNYLKEIDRIRNDIATENANTYSKNNIENLNESKDDYFKDPSDVLKSWPTRNSSYHDKSGFNDIFVQPRTKRQSSFISPCVAGSRWNSRMLFSKTNPSPVAAVKPQPQESSREQQIKSPAHSISENMNVQNNSLSETRTLRRSQRLLSGRVNSSPQNDTSESPEYRNNNSSKGVPKSNKNMSTKDNSDCENAWEQRRNQFNSRKFDRNTATATTVFSHDNENSFGEKCYARTSQQIHQTLPSSSVNPLHSKYNTKDSFGSSQNRVQSSQQHLKDAKIENDGSIFDFDDDSVIGQNPSVPFQSNRYKPERKISDWKLSSALKKDDSFWNSIRNAECQSDSSRDSSPSLSVTKVLIERKVNKPKRTSMMQASPDSGDGCNQYSKKVYKKKTTNQQGVNSQCNDSEDFLDQTDIDLYTKTVHHWDNKNWDTKISRSTQKRRLLSDNNPDTVEVMSTVKHQQKKKRY